MQVVSFTPRLLYLQGKSPRTNGGEEKNVLPLPRIEPYTFVSTMKYASSSKCRISRSRGGEYEDCCLLRFNAAQFGKVHRRF
jgi:hypothetical protein